MAVFAGFLPPSKINTGLKTIVVRKGKNETYSTWTLLFFWKRHMAKRKSWVGSGLSSLLTTQAKRRRPERDGGGRRLRLGPTVKLEALGRRAEYVVAVFAGLCGVSERTLVRDMDA